MNTSLEGKVVIVTGAAQGLGAAICERLTREKAKVIPVDIKGTDIKMDVTSEADVQGVFDRVVKEHGRVDVVVANAAILIAEPIAEADAEKWRAVMNVNLFGNFLTMKHACRVMKPHRKGSIIQINSKSGKKGSSANSAYAASKFGGIGLVQSVALEMAPHNIRCNAICPGNLLESPLWTDPMKGLFVQYLKAGKVPGAQTTDEVKQAYMNQVPMKRGCTYDDICNTVVFLADDASAYITGIALSVTGGQEMN